MECHRLRNKYEGYYKAAVTNNQGASISIMEASTSAEIRFQREKYSMPEKGEETSREFSTNMNEDILSSQDIDTSSPKGTGELVEGIALSVVEGLPALSYTSYETHCHALKAKIRACFFAAVYSTAGA